MNKVRSFLTKETRFLCKSRDFSARVLCMDVEGPKRCNFLMIILSTIVYFNPQFLSTQNVRRFPCTNIV